MTEAQPFGFVKKVTGAIGTCFQCHNRSEIGSDGLCGECGSIESVSYSNSVARPYITTNSDSERISLVKSIINIATTDDVERVLRELVKRKVLFYDFETVISNTRWFTDVDLKRIESKLQKGAENGRSARSSRGSSGSDSGIKVQGISGTSEVGTSIKRTRNKTRTIKQD